MDLSTLTQHVIQIAKEAGQYMLAERRKGGVEQITAKGLNDFVTEIDKASEKMIVDNLREVLPEAGFIAEEGTSDKKGERYNWVIDPLDGTTNYIHGLPCYCVSIALTDGEDVVSGVIYEPNLGECFHAFKDGKAWLNGQEIRVSSAGKLSDSLLATGFPYHDYSYMKAYLDLFEYFMKHTHGLRRWGSAAIDLAYVACGRFDGFYEYGLHAWDVAAGTVILQEAGGRVTDFNGGNKFIFGGELVASNTANHDEFLGAVQRFFG